MAVRIFFGGGPALAPVANSAAKAVKGVLAMKRVIGKRLGISMIKSLYLLFQKRILGLVPLLLISVAGGLAPNASMGQAPSPFMIVAMLEIENEIDGHSDITMIAHLDFLDFKWSGILRLLTSRGRYLCRFRGSFNSKACQICLKMTFFTASQFDNGVSHVL